MNLTFGTYFEQLQYEVGQLKRISAEPDFNSYLDSVVNRAKVAPQMSMELRKELIKNYLVYANRQRAIGLNAPATYMEAVYPGMEMPVVQQSAPQPVTAQPVQAQPVQAQPLGMYSNAAQSTPQAEAAYAQPQPAYYNQPVYGSQAPVQAKQPKVKKPGAEFAIGGIVLSILGTALILTGFIMLAVNFFDSMLQGLSLFAVCAVIVLVSELVVRRFVKKLSYVFTGLGIAGFFVVTLVNYFGLQLYNLWVALGLLALFSILTGVLARFKKNVLFTIIGYVSIFVSVGLTNSIESTPQMIALYSIMLAEMVLWIVFPVEGNTFPFSIVQAAGNFVFLICTMPWTPYLESDLKETAFVSRSIIVSVAFLVLILGTVVSALRCFLPKEENGVKVKGKNPVAMLVLFGSACLLNALMNGIYLEVVREDLHRNIVIAVSIAAFTLCTLAAVYVLKKKEEVIWQAIAVAGVAVCGVYVLFFTHKYAETIGVVIVALLASGLCFFAKKLGFKILDIITKVLVLGFAIALAVDNQYDQSTVSLIVIICGIVVLLALGSGFKVPGYCVLTAALMFASCALADERLYLMIISGILMVTVLAFHNVKWLKAKYILVFDILALVTLTFVLAFINLDLYKNDMVSTLVVFAFGLAVLVQYLMKSYGMFFAGNMMPLAVYLSYFVFMLRIDESFVTSAILMGVALCCVALGFLMKQKAVRIYGLVLSMLVCVKLVFFDFRGAASLTKTIMYFVVGVIALAIAGVYIVMEMLLLKKAQSEEKSVQNNNNNVTMQ